MGPLLSRCRPQSADIIEDELEVFELPAELQWLNQATSHPGTGPVDELNESSNSVDIPALGEEVERGDESRSSTPQSVLAGLEPVAAPKVVASERKRNLIGRPMHGERRNKGRGRPWFSGSREHA